MIGKTGVHSSATYLQATGFQTPGFPGAGCWISYALGSENENLPTFVVLPDHRGFASNGPKNWDSAFLPALHQGTTIFPGTDPPIQDLFPQNRRFTTTQGDAEGQNLLEVLNREHMNERAGDSRLEARIRSYELAAKMQLAAPEALNIREEPSYLLDQYGVSEDPREYPVEINPEEEAEYFGRKCLVARRLLERGVRFVQIWSGNDNGFPRRNWDSHENIKRDHGPLASGMARGASALIRDLKQRGMLEDTLILWTTEFGRMPSSQGGSGRDPIRFALRIGCAVVESAGESVSDQVTSGDSSHWIESIQPRFTISTRRSCTCWVSIISDLPSGIMASIEG